MIHAGRRLQAQLVSLSAWRGAQPVTAPLCCAHSSAAAPQDVPLAPLAEADVPIRAELPAATGRIDLILGPMFAGKTSELLRRIQVHEAAGRRVAVVKSDKDDRYHRSRLVTHDGQARECFATATLAQLRERLGAAYHDIDVFAIDEAQFFPDLLAFCTAAADSHAKHLLLAGLDGDFRRQRFGQVLDVLPLADTVTKLAARCAYCGTPALFSLRIAADARQEVVGGADKYAPVCRRHYAALETRLRLGPIPPAPAAGT
ncbi:hypothetical protein WJX81_002939 [Elliptochloris bilobata]|uniref:Thymidine kinase n=1 Tax=Elliptochloris bilobata TaxID=381761 RepID=A0AAW1QHR7_9CHLO